MNTPNIFKIATSELSQDAFITWLLTWGDSSFACQNPKLNECSVKFIQELIGKSDAIKSVKAGRQWNNIDVWAVINDHYFLLIEDKKGTKEHSNQLERYKEKVAETYPGLAVIPIYFKMDVQSNYDAVKEAGYKICHCEMMLNLLEPYVESSEILNSFHEYVSEINSSLNSYSHSKVEEWSKNWFAWRGFYSQLQNQFHDADWDYVPNRSGGFLGLWWHWKKIHFNGVEFRIYLQLEQEKLVVKLNCGDENQRKHIREVLRQHLYTEAKELNLSLKNHGRIGNFMGIVKLNHDYRMLDANGVMDYSQTVIVLQKATELIDKVSEKLKS